MRLCVVSGIVTSHSIHYPCFHSIKVTPSGRLSLRRRSDGFFAAGILALCMARHTMSFVMLFLVVLAELWRHDKPRVPLLSTSFPNGQMCGSQMLTPSLIPVAILIVSFAILSPTAVMGGDSSQSSECGAAAALSLA